jgi:Cdc6-like AAA superfamily ATPase
MTKKKQLFAPPFPSIQTTTFTIKQNQSSVILPSSLSKRNNIHRDLETIESYSTILERDMIRLEIKQILADFETNLHHLQFKKGIFIYGSPGCGKTHFIMQLLQELDYDIIKYDAGDVRNKSLIDTITNNNISSCNVLQMMNRVVKKKVIVMDEIDGMNNGDKGGIISLIKLIRQKKVAREF